MKLPIDLTVVVYFSPFVNLRDKSWTSPPLLAPPSEGKTWTLETDEGTKVNDHGKSMFLYKNLYIPWWVLSRGKKYLMV